MAKTVELKVYGMTCDDCVRHVSGGLKQAEGVTDVSVSLKDGMAVVKAMDTVDPENLLKLDVFKGQYKAQLKSVKNE
ncbi:MULTISPECIES: heavy-metal-associated domain-containing protein [Ferroplasma]|jgi:copper chaperone CopZ|uniref:Copper chaperone n=2 Tax=Ferroplasma TaxID=74968 RepID=S0ARH4_FERAC|nr:MULTISPECIES: heavy metal-associated domain-containing protein [Ferroplasma]AGO61576.1 copper chaperone [Ferroplasma acidarmanus Fer1]ARD84487.1 copper chaperone [Ferroplasma acidiphilum]MCL4348822.1 heavy-metal-associated domain-containing protein [Candidatus Thermoplasmatota archaeon]WMT53416.1 MAG: heavy metal-associated domain-containing protein [Ferroplasma acidiphilum]